MREPEGLQRMFAVSLLVHGAAVAILILAPGGWFGSRAEPPRKTVMTISLGGGVPGPENGGLTTIAGRAIQTPTAEPLRRIDQTAAPAAKDCPAVGLVRLTVGVWLPPPPPPQAVPLRVKAVGLE